MTNVEGLIRNTLTTYYIVRGSRWQPMIQYWLVAGRCMKHPRQSNSIQRRDVSNWFMHAAEQEITITTKHIVIVSYYQTYISTIPFISPMTFTSEPYIARFILAICQPVHLDLPAPVESHQLVTTWNMCTPQTTPPDEGRIWMRLT